jgi:phosphoglycerate dehydrogenase-like enzyme
MTVQLLSAGILLCVSMAGQTRKIVVTGMDAPAVRELQAAVPDAKVVAAAGDQVASEVVDADAVLGGLNAAAFRAAKRLKWIQTYSAGVENQLFPEMRSSDVMLTNGKIIQGPEIADHALALLLALTRSLYQTIPGRTTEKWTRGQHEPIELNGKTAVILGVGGIGMQIAQRAHAFGMRVIGVDPKDVSYTYFLTRVVPPDRLDTVLPEADVVFVSAPYTQQSERMMGARQFELMKPNSYFIVVSRGRLYDTDALVKAIDSKRLAGAGLDVTNPEPLPPGHALWKFDNVLITPHIAGRSDRVQERRMDLLKENLRRFVKGEPLLNVVDKQRGY